MPDKKKPSKKAAAKKDKVAAVNARIDKIVKNLNAALGTDVEAD